MYDTYALIDSCSTDSFCSENLLKKLKLSGPVQTLSLNTIEINNVKIFGQVVNLTVKGKNETEWLDVLNVYSRPNIMVDLKNRVYQSDFNKFPHLKNIKFPCISDEFFENIDLLIGQRTPRAFIPYEVCSGGSDDP